jgi:hypothetical protein
MRRDVREPNGLRPDWCAVPLNIVEPSATQRRDRLFDQGVPGFT